MRRPWCFPSGRLKRASDELLSGVAASGAAASGEATGDATIGSEVVRLRRVLQLELLEQR